MISDQSSVSGVQPGLCAGCGRYIGAADVCPYCDADSSRPPAFKHLRAMAWILSTAGLATLWAVAGGRDVPDLRVSEITPMMNFATVRITGEVAGKPRTRRRGDQVDYTSFSLWDGSGSVRVAAYDSVARDLASRDDAPRKGAGVAVVGRLDVRAGSRPVLRVQTADHVTVVELPQQPPAHSQQPTSGAAASVSERTPAHH